MIYQLELSKEYFDNVYNEYRWNFKNEDLFLPGDIVELVNFPKSAFHKEGMMGVVVRHSMWDKHYLINLKPYNNLPDGWDEDHIDHQYLKRVRHRI